MPSRNAAGMRLTLDRFEAYLAAGSTAAVRITRRTVSKATPKLKQYAAQWSVGVGAPPDAFPPRESQALFPLPGDAETDAGMARFKLGDDVHLVSPASLPPYDYLQYLNEGSSPQAPANFIQDAITEAEGEFLSWRWDGAR